MASEMPVSVITDADTWRCSPKGSRREAVAAHVEEPAQAAPAGDEGAPVVEALRAPSGDPGVDIALMGGQGLGESGGVPTALVTPKPVWGRATKAASPMTIARPKAISGGSRS